MVAPRKPCTPRRYSLTRPEVSAAGGEDILRSLLAALVPVSEHVPASEECAQHTRLNRPQDTRHHGTVPAARG